MSRILLRTARFTSGLPQCIALAFMLLASVFALPAPTRPPVHPMALVLAASLFLLLPVLSSALVARKPFAERLLIIGMSPLARKILEAMTACPDCAYRIIGVV